MLRLIWRLSTHVLQSWNLFFTGLVFLLFLSYFKWLWSETCWVLVLELKCFLFLICFGFKVISLFFFSQFCWKMDLKFWASNLFLLNQYLLSMLVLCTENLFRVPSDHFTNKHVYPSDVIRCWIVTWNCVMMIEIQTIESG